MASNQAPVVDRIRIIPRPDDFLDRNVGASGEVFFDKAANTLRVYNGRLAGGFEVVTKTNLQNSIKESDIATVRYTVVIENQGEGNKYILNGAYKPELNFVVGYTYVFDQSDDINVYYPNAIGTINNQHPLNFSADNLNGVLGGGTSYLDGVEYRLDDEVVTQEQYFSGFQNADIRTVSIHVTNDTPSTLYYWCQLHLNMGNTINVADPGSGTGTGSGASVELSDNAPEDPTAGTIWFETDSGRLFVYVEDEDSAQWVQPTAPIPAFNTFGSVVVGTDTIAAANRSDVLTIAAGDNITLDVNTGTNTLTINGQAGGGGGSVYDQDLNTTDDVDFNSITTSTATITDLTAQTFTNNGVGAPVFDSASTFTITAPDGIILDGLSIFAGQSESMSTYTGATGIVNHNIETSSVHYHSSVAANFTANFTNVPTTDNRTTTVTLIVSQGATPYLPTVVTIDGASATVNYPGGIAPTGTANAVDIVTFVLIRTGSTWTVIGSASSYG